eukprot:TRINITY_DN81_c0_g1_i2.p1 TRINITY_DN81_c0_g1~~TRINITY_DN81_c0_g1_i2.p1  ORF type:complete len:145 (+),score=14.76 TRINITY_DN81_c0_g1_i2:416-850(+)
MLARFSLVSALEDTRFKPINKKEIPMLQCGVNLLHSFEDSKDHLDWEIGIHGVMIDYYIYNSKGQEIFDGHAIFLPHVASSNNWKKDETIRQLIRKGGWKGKYNLKEIKIITKRFQASCCNSDYDSYLLFKEERRSNDLLIKVR